MNKSRPLNRKQMDSALIYFIMTLFLLWHVGMTSVKKPLFRVLNECEASETHQVILPALGRVLRVPLLLWRAHCRIYIGRVSIAVVAWIIAPVPSSASHSGELKSKQQVDLNLHSRDKHTFHIKMEEYWINMVQVRVKTRPRHDDRTHKLKPYWWKSGICLVMRWVPLICATLP